MQEYTYKAASGLSEAAFLKISGNIASATPTLHCSPFFVISIIIKDAIGILTGGGCLAAIKAKPLAYHSCRSFQKLSGR